MARNTSGLRRGGGRHEPNKLTKSAREAFQLAFDNIGGPSALTAWAKANPAQFFQLYARLIPVEHTGPHEGPMQTVVKHVYEQVTEKP